MEGGCGEYLQTSWFRSPSPAGVPDPRDSPRATNVADAESVE